MGTFTARPSTFIRFQSRCRSNMEISKNVAMRQIAWPPDNALMNLSGDKAVGCTAFTGHSARRSGSMAEMSNCFH